MPLPILTQQTSLTRERELFQTFTEQRETMRKLKDGIETNTGEMKSLRKDIGDLKKEFLTSMQGFKDLKGYFEKNINPRVESKTTESKEKEKNSLSSMLKSLLSFGASKPKSSLELKYYEDIAKIRNLTQLNNRELSIIRRAFEPRQIEKDQDRLAEKIALALGGGGGGGGGLFAFLGAGLAKMLTSLGSTIKSGIATLSSNLFSAISSLGKMLLRGLTTAIGTILRTVLPAILRMIPLLLNPLAIGTAIVAALGYKAFESIQERGNEIRNNPNKTSNPSESGRTDPNKIGIQPSAPGTEGMTPEEVIETNMMKEMDYTATEAEFKQMDSNLSGIRKNGELVRNSYNKQAKKILNENDKNIKYEAMLDAVAKRRAMLQEAIANGDEYAAAEELARMDEAANKARKDIEQKYQVSTTKDPEKQIETIISDAQKQAEETTTSVKETIAEGMADDISTFMSEGVADALKGLERMLTFDNVSILPGLGNFMQRELNKMTNFIELGKDQLEEQKQSASGGNNVSVVDIKQGGQTSVMGLTSSALNSDPAVVLYKQLSPIK